MSDFPASPARRLHRLSLLFVLAVALVPFEPRANPIPESVAIELNERPERWLQKPTPEDEKRLVESFGRYSFTPGLLTPATFELFSREFDRFAPLMIAGQRPPHAVQPMLQT